MTLHDTLVDTPFDTLDVTSAGGPPMVSQAEAARICKVSTATLRRRRTELEQHGAKPDPTGGWLIPIPALVACGLLDRTTPPDTRAASTMSPDTTPLHNGGVSPLDTRLVELQDQLDRADRRVQDAEHRAELAEAIADERGKALEVERMALRILTQTAHPAPVAPSTEFSGGVPHLGEPGSRLPKPTPPAPESARPRRWWSRKSR